MKIIFYCIFLIVFFNIKLLGQKTYHLYENDTSVFEISSVDGNLYHVLRTDTILKEGNYIVYNKYYKHKKYIVRKFSINREGKYCGDYIEYFLSGKIKRREKYDVCSF